MGPLTYWLHMDQEFMWRWYACGSDGRMLLQSETSFVNRSDAEQDLLMARDARRHIKLVG